MSPLRRRHGHLGVARVLQGVGRFAEIRSRVAIS